MEKIAVVTGSSSGIGKAVTELLLKKEYKVYGISREAELINNSNFIQIEADLLDLVSYEEIKKAVTESRIDLLVNNAGVIIKQNGLEFTEDVFEKTIGTNFKAPILLTQALKDKLNGSLVVNVSSVSDRLVGEQSGLYCASKAALNKYFETMAIEEKGIKFVSILPSYVDTPLLHKLEDGHNFNWNEVIKPGEIAELIEKVISGEIKFSSGAKIIVVTDALKDDLEYNEDLWGYNVNTKMLSEL